MKKIFFFILIVLSVKCSVDDSDGDNTQGSGKWNLLTIEGGVEGSEINLSSGQITWVFDDLQGILYVENNVNNIPTGVSEGNHDYRIETSGNDSFIFIDDVEYGAISIGTRSFTIDQNITTSGTAADKFILKFRR